LLGSPFGGRTWPAALALAVIGATVLPGLGALLLHRRGTPQRPTRTWLIVAVTAAMLLASLTANGPAENQVKVAFFLLGVGGLLAALAADQQHG
jgi:hypothetical protein